MKILICLVLAAGFVWGAAVVSGHIRVQRDRFLPHEQLEYHQESPWVRLISVLMGAGRGPYIISQWWQANELQQSEQYEELDLLYTRICMLEKYFVNVWAYAAWNEAYNISVKHHRPQDRWRWVRQGIEMLRDKCLRYNPRAARLYFELAWIYQHKIRSLSDDHHKFYKARLSELT